MRPAARRCPADERGPLSVAVVLPGGGARGAYEVGALSVLLPALEARGERVTIACGTSVGAINAAVFAALAHLPAAEQGEAMVERWRSLRKGDFVSRIVGPATIRNALRLSADALGVPGLPAGSLLDPAPLHRSLDRWIDWDDLRRNLRRGSIEVACTIATSLAAGVPVAFVDGRRPAPRTAGHGLRYVKTRLAAEHVQASAAIPLLFPPVRVRRPASVAGAYVDGATRLNTPIKPALALGAKRVIVIAFEPLDRPGARGVSGRPRLTDVAATILDGLLVDQVVDDVHRLAAINAFFGETPEAALSAAARGYRTVRGRAQYRRVPYALVAPAEPGELGRLAGEVLDARHGSVRALLDPDYALLSLLLGRGRATTAELLSFLLFDEAYIERLIAAGRKDAQRWLDRHPRFWCSDPSHDLGIAADDGNTAREHQALEEFRLLKRR
ncbi:MAG: patatin-like phospholipase family protein [Solirubrobacteraceae bacterium]